MNTPALAFFRLRRFGARAIHPLLAVLLTAAASAAERESGDLTLVDDRSEKGFERLFDGKDLTGWDGNFKLWYVKDGTITGQTTAENPMKNNTFLIWTNGVVTDFEFRCSYRIIANNDKGFANSGVQYRSTVLDPANWVVGGYQADMEAGQTYSGILYEERMSRGIMAARGEKVVWDSDCKKQVTGSLGKSEDIQATIKPGDWNQYRIIAIGNHLQHFINGMQTVDVTDNCEAKRAMKGVLALQLHAGQPMSVQFRDLRLRKQGPGNGAAAPDLGPLQGVWRVARLEIEGSALSAENATNIIVTVKDSSYTVEGTENDGAGKFSVDQSRKPWRMDINPENGNDQALTAIYELVPDGFRVCYAPRGEQRPDGFVTEPGDRRVLITYKRK